jgi:hypothetical protein
MAPYRWLRWLRPGRPTRKNYQPPVPHWEMSYKVPNGSTTTTSVNLNFLSLDLVEASIERSMGGVPDSAIEMAQRLLQKIQRLQPWRVEGRGYQDNEDEGKYDKGKTPYVLQIS